MLATSLRDGAVGPSLSSKMEKHLDVECVDSAVINDKITNDNLLKTVFFLIRDLY